MLGTSWRALVPLRAHAAGTGVLRPGKVSDDPKGDYEPTKPLLDYIVLGLADIGVREGRGFFNITRFAPLDGGSQRILDEVARSVGRVREALE